MTPAVPSTPAAAPRDVTLRLDDEPRFPELCVACGRTEALRHVTVRRLGLSRKAVIPMCGVCAWSQRLGRITRVGVWAAAFSLSAVGINNAFPDYNWTARFLFTISAGTWVYLPLRIWRVFVPPILELLPGSGSVTYRFRHPEYAALFAQANEARAY